MIEQLDPAWIERLGGWAAVLVVVRWMMSRMDRTLDNQDKSLESMQSAITSFQNFQTLEEETHGRLVATQREILESVRELRQQISAQ